MGFPGGPAALPVGFAALPVGFEAIPIGPVGLPVGFPAPPVGFMTLLYVRDIVGRRSLLGTCMIIIILFRFRFI